MTRLILLIMLVQLSFSLSNLKIQEFVDWQYFKAFHSLFILSYLIVSFVISNRPRRCSIDNDFETFISTTSNCGGVTSPINLCFMFSLCFSEQDSLMMLLHSRQSISLNRWIAYSQNHHAQFALFQVDANLKL